MAGGRKRAGVGRKMGGLVQRKLLGREKENGLGGGKKKERGQKKMEGGREEAEGERERVGKGETREREGSGLHREKVKHTFGDKIYLKLQRPG